MVESSGPFATVLWGKREDVVCGGDRNTKSLAVSKSQADRSLYHQKSSTAQCAHMRTEGLAGLHEAKFKT